MNILRMAALAIAASLLLASPPARAQAGHMGGAHGRIAGGGSHFNGMGHRGGFHHGAGVHHFRGSGSVFVLGGIWYPWYASSYPVYAYPVYSAGAYYSYYCQSAGRYYPEITACPEGWMVVAAPPVVQ